VALKALLFDWLYLGLHFKAAENGAPSIAMVALTAFLGNTVINKPKMSIKETTV
jgi:hypothetical protein